MVYIAWISALAWRSSSSRALLGQVLIDGISDRLSQQAAWGLLVIAEGKWSKAQLQRFKSLRQWLCWMKVAGEAAVAAFAVSAFVVFVVVVARGYCIRRR